MKKLTLSLFIFLGIGLFAKHVLKPKPAPYLSVVGFVRMADGLGRQCPEMIEALKDEFDVGFIPLAKSNFKDVKESILPLIKFPNFKQGTVVILNDNPWRPVKKGTPYGALRVFKEPKNKDQIRICYTMVESTRIPKEWVEILNTYFDLVCVPDPFLEEAFTASGVTIPVFTLPLGLDLNPLLKQPVKTSYNSIFRIATLGSLSDRKNQIKLAEAFDMAFNKDPKVELFIHARRADRIYKQEFLKVLDALKNPMIHFEETLLDQDEYLKLFSSVDLLVNASKGEGFSIQPREAMALGIPCLVTNNTAQKTLISDAKVISLETPIEKPQYYNQYKQVCGNSFDFTTESLAAALKEAYENKESLLKTSKVNRAYAETFDYSKIKNLYKNLVKPALIIKSDKNHITENGLETSSDELIEKYKRLAGACL